MARDRGTGATNSGGAFALVIWSHHRMSLRLISNPLHRKVERRGWVRTDGRFVRARACYAAVAGAMCWLFAGKVDVCGLCGWDEVGLG